MWKATVLPQIGLIFSVSNLLKLIIPEHLMFLFQKTLFKGTLQAESELFLSCRGPEGTRIKPHSIIRPPPLSPFSSSHRSWGARLQHNITGRSHRWFRSHLREEHSASGSCHPGRPAEGRRPAAGGETARRFGCAQDCSLSVISDGAELWEQPMRSEH